MNTVTHYIFIALALFGLTVNVLGLGYLITNTIRTITGNGWPL